MADPIGAFQTGYNIGSKPNAVGRTILSVMEKYKQNQDLMNQLQMKGTLSKWEQENVTGPAETAKFEREKGWEEKKIGIEHKNKLAQIKETGKYKSNDILSVLGIGGVSGGKPTQVEQSDWDLATEEEKQALIEHFGG